MDGKFQIIHLTTASPVQASCSNRIIIVIDDSATERAVIKISLGWEGFAIHAFSDGVEAMCWLTERDPPPPALIILYFGLPKLGRYKIARRLKAKPPFRQIIIVMLARSDGQIDRPKERLAGVNAYITKPSTIQQIVEVAQVHRSLLSSREGGRLS